MRNIYKVLLVLVFTINTLFAIEESNIKPYMEVKINKATFILKNELLPRETKEKEVFALLDDIFDYKLMAKITLGKKYRTLTKIEKDNFIKAYEQKLKNSYLDKLKLYTDEQTLVKELKKVKKTRIVLYTELIGKDGVFKINYKFYRNKQSQWLIYDVELLGTSIIQSDRVQFKNYLKEHTIAQLIKIM